MSYLLDLKIGKFTHPDAGQMNMYLNYYKENEGYDGDNIQIRIIYVLVKMTHW